MPEVLEEDSHKSLKQEISFLYQLIDQIGDELFLFNKEGNVVFANKSAIKNSHHKEEKLLSLSIKDIFFIDMNINQWYQEYFIKIKDSKEGRKNYLFQKEGANHKLVTVNVVATYLRMTSSEFIVMSAREVDTKVVESNKMKTLQTVISGYSQELQQPIRSIYQYTNDIIKEFKNKNFEYIGFKDYERIFQTLKVVCDQSKYYVDISEKILRTYKKKSGVKVSHSAVNEVLRSIINSFQQECGYKDINFCIQFDNLLTNVAIDKVNFDQVIRGIVNNAIQAMPTGGKICVWTKLDIETNECVLEFKDTGVGIPKEVLTHIFDPFYTTKQRGLNKSSGLGLFIVRSILYSFKGDISLKSNLRTGTHIQIRLPIYKIKK